MRKTLLHLTMAMLVLAFGGLADAQSAASQTINAQNMVQTNAAHQNEASAGYESQSDQPMSLGEIARLARASKNSQPKAVKIFDDDNMPRAPLTAGQKAPGFGGQGQGRPGNEGSGSGGKVTLLDFWATWCGVCREALPGLKKLESSYRGDDFEVVSVSEDENEGAWRDYVAQHNMTWTQRLDSSHQMLRQYGANALPTYVLIDRDGNVVQTYVGDDPAESVSDRIGPDLRKILQGSS